MLVGKDSAGNPVYISGTAVARVNKYQGDVKAAILAQETADAMERAEKSLAYKQNRDSFGIARGVNTETNEELNLVWVRGIGTRFNGCFTKRGGLDLIKNFDQFKAMILSLPDEE